MSIEDNAFETAVYLLQDAIESVEALPETEKIGVAKAILMSNHAIVAKLDAMETTHLEAMRVLQEAIINLASSIKTLGAQFDEKIHTLTPTTQESEVMYRALEDNYLRSHQASSLEEMDAQLRRFKCLAGG